MNKPYYLDKKKDEIPTVNKNGIFARILSGELFGVKGALNDFKT